MGVMNDPRVIYLDTETTGFGPRAEIVDIAAVSAAGEVVLESLVQPTRRIPADAAAIHGITNADVKHAPAWCDLYEDLLRVLAGRRIIVYNVIFDRQMVNQACERYDLAAPAADWECAMRKYAGFRKWDSGRWYRFQKLERAVLAFGAEPGGHRAAADAVACCERGAWHGRDAASYARARHQRLRSIPNERGMFRPTKPRSPAMTGGRHRRRPRVLTSNQSTRIRVGRAPFSSSSRCSNRFRQSCATPRRLRRVVSARSRCPLRRLGMGSRAPAAPHRRRSDAS